MITMGTLLILAPIGADYLFQRNLVSLLTSQQSISPIVMPHLSTWYRIICWLMGSLMVLIGTLAAMTDARTSFYARPNVQDEDEDEDEEEEEQDDGETA
jgi:hypothetical protein